MRAVSRETSNFRPAKSINSTAAAEVLMSGMVRLWRLRRVARIPTSRFAASRGLRIVIGPVGFQEQIRAEAAIEQGGSF